MKKLFFILLLAAPAWATDHPRLLCTRAQWAGMISSSTIRPWSDLKAGATTFYASALGATIRNPTTYTSTFGSGNANVCQQQENIYAAALGNLTLLYVLNTNNASSGTYRGQITALMDVWPGLFNDEITTPDITTGYGVAVPLNTAFMSMTLAMDNIHDDLTTVVRSSYHVMMDSYTAYSRAQASSWALNNYGTYLTYELYRDTAPAQVIIDSNCYHALLLGNETIYPPAVCDMRQAYHGLSSELQPNTQLNVDGISGSGSAYAWARIGGSSREKMGKWGGVHVAAFTGTDTSYTSDDKMANFYEWLFVGHTTPWNTKVVFGDTANNQGIGDDEYIGLDAIYPGAIYVLPNAYFAAGKYSALAQQYANRSINISTVTVVYPFEFVDYALITSTNVTSQPVQSTVVQYGGAAFWEQDTTVNALMGVLDNYHITKNDHYHASDFNGLFLAGYGETLLSNVGVGSGTSDGVLGFHWWWHHDDAHSGNVALINNRNYAQDLNMFGVYDNSYWNWNPITPFVGNPGVTPLYGGDGITESLLSSNFDYAVGLGTSQYVFRSTTTGAIRETLGQNERNFFFVHPDTTTGTNGYWIVVDEVHSSSGGSVNTVWHPYGTSFSTTTLNQEYAWPISSRAAASTTTLHIFLATPPLGVTNSSSPFSASPASFVAPYINANYTVDTSSNARVVTVLYPTNPTHAKSTFTRVAGGGQITSGSYDDYIIASAGTSTVSSQGTSFRGKIAFFRDGPSGISQFFVRQGTSFDDGGGARYGFSSNVPVSMHLSGNYGTITSTVAATVSFYKDSISTVAVDGVAVSGIGGSDVYTVDISSGPHDLAFAVSDRNLISSMTWTESGDYKMARQDQLPYVNGAFRSTHTISRIWDGTTIKLFGGKGELLTWVTYLNAGTSDATNVMVRLSSFTGTGLAAGTGIVAVAVSSTAVWDYSQRPYSLYKYGYLQQVGLGDLGTGWDISEYDVQQFPHRWRVPCTLQANLSCTPTDAYGTGTYTFNARQDHDKFYPDAAVPMEEFAISSFTVSASSSQAIGGEVYISTNMVANSTYTATLTVYEGASISTIIPVALYVYNVVLPGTSTIPVIAYVGESDLAIRLNGVRSPGNFYAEPYLTSGLRAAAFLHRHKIIPIGDIAPTGKDYPSDGYIKHHDGSAYRETYGLSPETGPGYGIGDTFHMIGTYGSWISATWSTTTVSGATGYCTNVSSWTSYCVANDLNCQLYTSDDEAAGAIVAGRVNTFSTWSSTVTACASGGNTLPFLHTGSLPGLASSAPYVTTVLSGGWLGYSSTTWATQEAIYNASGSTRAAGGYNSGLGVDSLYAHQEEGLGPREVMWGAYKTNQRYWFLWAINYWNDENNGGQTANGWNADANEDNDVFNIAKTFGYDNYPATNPVRGHLGASFSPGDGLMIYPGTDSVYANPSFGFNGVLGSWRLNSLTRGIQDVDIIALAYAVDPSATMAIVNEQVQNVMYLRQCANLADCTYSYGVRPWNENLSTWETARESLLQIASSTAEPSPSVIIRGGITIKGGVSIK